MKSLHKPKRLKTFAVSVQVLEDFLLGKEHHFRIETPLPKDAKITTLGHDFFCQTVHAVVESKEFEPVREAAPIPQSMIVVTDLKCIDTPKLQTLLTARKEFFQGIKTKKVSKELVITLLSELIGLTQYPDMIDEKLNKCGK